MASELGLEPRQQFGVHAGVDFAAQDRLGALDRERGHLVAQRLARLHRFLLGFGTRGGDDLRALLAGARLGVLDDLLRQVLGVGEALRAVLARLRELGFGALVGRGQIGLGPIGGGQPVGDLLRPLVQRRGDRRPDEPHREPDQDPEHDHLDDQGSGDAHFMASWRWWRRGRCAAARCLDDRGRRAPYLAPAAAATAAAIWPRNGLAVANHSAIPTPMMNEASIRPTSRNILVCSSPINSGCRAADSRYLLPMMPMPIQAPMAPRPMIRPTASATKLITSMIAPRGLWLTRKGEDET